MTDLKTTSAGIATLATAVGVILHMVSTGMWDANVLGTTIIGILGGFGLVAAKDA